MTKSNNKLEGRTRIIRLVNDTRLYRKIPVIRRLVPSLYKRLERLIWPGGRTMRTTPLRLIGINAGRIHIFGDSHSWVFRSTPQASVHYLNTGITMHRVGRDGMQVFGLDDFDIKPGEALGFVYGEIDVRAHVAKQRDLFSRDANEIIETLAANYLSTLAEVKKTYPSSPLIVISLPPPIGRGYPNYNRYKLDYPAGPEPDRIAWTKQLNDLLRRGAAREGFGFLDQYTPFVNEKGLLNLSMTADGIHLTPNPPGKDVQDMVCFWE